MTRRARFCRCCGMATESGAYCPACHGHTVRHAAIVAETITELWGTDGLNRYQVTLRARRLTARRTENGRAV